MPFGRRKEEEKTKVFKIHTKDEQVCKSLGGIWDEESEACYIVGKESEEGLTIEQNVEYESQAVVREREISRRKAVKSPEEIM